MRWPHVKDLSHKAYVHRKSQGKIAHLLLCHSITVVGQLATEHLVLVVPLPKILARNDQTDALALLWTAALSLIPNAGHDRTTTQHPQTEEMALQIHFPELRWNTAPAPGRENKEQRFGMFTAERTSFLLVY